MYLHLRRDGKTELSSAVLGRLTHRWLRRDPGPEAARRYLAWTAYRRSDRPLVVLIGGTVGCGKSTIATEVASRLGIVRIQSTDMLREVMRMMLPERLLPVLHTSSFNAWQVLPLARGSRGDRDALVAEGYRSQAELVSVPCEAVVRRALQEQVSLVLEGVHVQPDLAGRLPAADEAIVVPLVLAVLSPEQLQRRLRGRGELTPQRRAHRYLRQFDAIWSLQGHILAEADRLGVPIIPNDERMRAVQAVLSTVVDALVARFEGTPRQVLRRFR
jgi:2-phosphoglycerate kinase